MRYVLPMIVLFAGPAAAEDASPWFGSMDQVPFQMSADGDRITARAAGGDGRFAQAEESVDCSITGCSMADGSAKVLGTGLVSP